MIGERRKKTDASGWIDLISLSDCLKWKKIPAHVLILEFGFISMRYCLDTVGEFLEQTFQSCLFDGSPEALLEGKYKHINLGSILDYPKKNLRLVRTISKRF